MEENKKENKKIKLEVIISIIAIIIILVLVGVLFNNNKKMNNEIDKINGTNKKAITAEEFKNFITTKGFNIATEKDVFTKEAITKAGIKKGYITKNIEDEEYRINFYEFEDENSEQYMYYDAINLIRLEGNWSIQENTEKSMNHTKYTAITNNNYLVVSRIGNTLLWANINVDNKQELINLLNELGY